MRQRVSGSFCFWGLGAAVAALVFAVLLGDLWSCGERSHSATGEFVCRLRRTLFSGRFGGLLLADLAGLCCGSDALRSDRSIHSLVLRRYRGIRHGFLSDGNRGRQLWTRI